MHQVFELPKKFKMMGAICVEVLDQLADEKHEYVVKSIVNI